MTGYEPDGAGRGRAAFFVKTGLCLGAACLLLASAASYAGTDDEFRAALSLYQRGDVVGAIAKLRPGADAGHARSQTLLADILDGAGFTDEALAWYRKAADVGEAEAMFALGSAYTAGRGVARDEEKGRDLVLRAAQAGHKGAINSVAQSTMDGTLGFAKLNAQDRSGLPWVKQAAANGHLPAIDYLAAAYRTGALGETDQKQADAFATQAEQIRSAGRKKQTRKKAS